MDGAEWTRWARWSWPRATAKTTCTPGQHYRRFRRAAPVRCLTVNSGYGTMGQFGLSEVSSCSASAGVRSRLRYDGCRGRHDLWLASGPGQKPLRTRVYLGPIQRVFLWLELLPTSVFTPDDSVRRQLLLASGRGQRGRGGQPLKATSGAYDRRIRCCGRHGELHERCGRGRSQAFQAWVDGWERTTGALVGHLDAPFAERTVVHGGRQSMLPGVLRLLPAELLGDRANVRVPQ